MNPTRDSPHIVGELAKLGITIAKLTVEKYMVRTAKPPSQTWRTFLTNHAKDTEAIEFVESLACPSCEVSVLDMHEEAVASRAKLLGIGRVPAVIIKWQARRLLRK